MLLHQICFLYAGAVIIARREILSNNAKGAREGLWPKLRASIESNWNKILLGVRVMGYS